MRKILIGILTILLIVMAVLVITKGLTIGNFKILSVKQIIEGNDSRNFRNRKINQKQLSN